MANYCCSILARASKIAAAVWAKVGIAGKLFGVAWECVQFWTPISTTIILLWLLYRPDQFHPTVDSAVLAALNSTAPPANSTDQPIRSLRYDLAVDLSLRNSHRHLSIRYLDIGATAFYNGSTRLGSTNDALPTPFRQRPNNTTVLHPTFWGTVAVNSSIAAELERERAAGTTVQVRVRVWTTIMYKVWPMKEIFYYKYDCWLSFPPPHDGAPAVFDAGTQCWDVGKNKDS